MIRFPSPRFVHLRCGWDPLGAGWSCVGEAGELELELELDLALDLDCSSVPSTPTPRRPYSLCTSHAEPLTFFFLNILSHMPR